jgi:hypothetical protein
LRELEILKKEEVRKRELIEMEKEKLIKEHEDILKGYYAKGYYKSMSTLNSNKSTNSNFSTQGFK